MGCPSSSSIIIGVFRDKEDKELTEYCDKHFECNNHAQCGNWNIENEDDEDNFVYEIDNCGWTRIDSCEGATSINPYEIVKALEKAEKDHPEIAGSIEAILTCDIEC